MIFAYSLLLIGTIKFYICSRKLLIMTMLLPDAEIFEDIAQDFVGGDLAGDGTKVVQAFTNILGKKFT